VIPECLFMIDDPVTEHKELTEVVFKAGDLVSGSLESKRAKRSGDRLTIAEIERVSFEALFESA
jgi:hypothetical protein